MTSTQPRLADRLAAGFMKPIRIRIAKYVLANGQRTYALRWTTPPAETGGKPTETLLRLFRTEPYPRLASVRDWEREAAILRWQKERELNEGVEDFMVPTEPGEAARLYIDYCAREKSTSKTHRAERVCQAFVEWLRTHGSPATISRVTMGLMAQYRGYLEEQDIGPATVNLYMADLSAWFGFLAEENRLKENPCRNVRPLATEAQRARLRIEGADVLWELLGRMDCDWRRSTTALLAMTGLRVGEASALRWDHWDQGEDVLLIGCEEDAAGTTKRHTRVLPVIGTLRTNLLCLQTFQTGPYIVGAQQGTIPLLTQVNRWLRPLAIRPHDLRRWFRTALETIGAQQYVIDDLLGHRTVKVRNAYTAGHKGAASMDELRRTMALFATWLESGRPEQGRTDLTSMPPAQSLEAASTPSLGPPS